MEILKISWENIHSNLRMLAHSIEASKIHYDFIYGIPRGGLIPATILSHLLHIPIMTHLEYETFNEKEILIVDDIIDSGETIKKFHDVFHTAAIFVKKNVKIKPTHYHSLGLINDKCWIMFPWEIDTCDPISQINIGDRHDCKQLEI